MQNEGADSTLLVFPLDDTIVGLEFVPSRASLSQRHITKQARARSVRTPRWRRGEYHSL